MDHPSTILVRRFFEILFWKTGSDPFLMVGARTKKKMERERYKLQQPKTKSFWRWGASIPLPTACEAVALPFELHPPVRPLTSYGVIESNEEKKTCHSKSSNQSFPSYAGLQPRFFPNCYGMGNEAEGSFLGPFESRVRQLEPPATLRLWHVPL